jgi:2-keto-4-pentenoate hydratase/2-oxohepta-3-ene-1,7-dioic acid hydratase in catechol pathway
MRLLRVGPAGAERPAVLIDGTIRDVSAEVADYDGAFFAGGGLDRLRAFVAASGDSLPAVDDETRVGPPVRRPGKVVCIGLNYADHAAESGAPLPAEPVVFMKDPSTVIGPYDDVRIPRTSLKTDWEVELGVVIGATARYLDRVEDAAGVIAGYCVSHDVSERHFQLERGGQWDKGKSCETFNPLGPLLVTADEVPDPQRLGLSLFVNGEPRQNGNTSNMIFPVHMVVHYLSQFMVLEPGDVVNTGTPAGVGMGMSPPTYLRDGDVVELGVEGLGEQRQTFVPAP